jgi:RNA-directed DNA polymerase
VNTDAPWPSLDEARVRVLKIQTKLHQWATDSPDRRFDDLSNLVCDPAFLTVGWDRVRGNRGARTAGVDGVKPRAIGRKDGETFLRELRDDLKARRFFSLPVRERMIPKASGKLRRLGIPTARDRVVQASLKLVLEPIFEADFHPCSYGFRPKRRAHDAIEEIRHFSRLSYEWVLEGDIASCFDEISHVGLLDRVRDRVADKRVTGLVKAFLIAGILTEDGAVRGTKTGTPQGGILSPLLANIALSVLDEHFAEAWETMMANDYDRRRRRRRGEPMYRLVRYADDFVVLVSGTKAQAEALKVDVAAVLSTMGLRLLGTTV